jgi:hypothetical protein
MAEYKKFVVSNFRTAKFLGRDRWLAPDDAFPVLLNAVVEKGIITRRLGSVEFADLGGWIERQPAGDAERIWAGVAMDSDGSNLIAGVGQGDTGTDRLYTSSNYGSNWTERQPAGDVDRLWLSVASDSDGSFLVAAAWNSRLYTSADSGVTWTERQPAGNTNIAWRWVDCDSDGSVVIACVSNGRIYISTDSGVNWSETRPDGDANRLWSDVKTDADGTNLIACSRQGASTGKVFTSANGGTNWTERTPAGAGTFDWWHVATDSDGSALLAAEEVGRLWSSTDSGATWSELRPHGVDRDDNWSAVAMDSDGTFLVACVQHRISPTVGSLLWYSSDSGSTWTSREFGDSDVTTLYCDCDSDGSHMIAGTGEFFAQSNGRLWTFGPSLPITGFNKISYAGYNEVLVCTTQNVYHLHQDGVAVNLGPSGAGFTGDEDDFFWFQEYNGSLYFTNGVDAVFKHTPNYTLPYSIPEIVTAGDVTIQTCIMLFAYKNRLIFVAPTISNVWYPDRIYWTDANVDTVSSANWVRAQQDITPMTGGYQDEVPVIFCLDGSIWHITYTQDVDTPFAYRRKQQYHGGRAKMATVEVNNALATFGLTRMVTYDGHVAKEFDAKIRGFYADLNDQKILWAYGHRMLDRNFAAWTYTRDGQTDHDRILWYNIDDDNFSDSDVAVNSLFSLKGPWLPEGTTPGNFYYPIRDADFQEYEFGGTKDGRVLRLNTGYQDEGVNIATEIRSAQLNPFQRDGFRCTMGWVKFLLSGASGEGITISFYKNDSSTAFRTVKIDSPGTTKTWQTANIQGETADFFTMRIVNTYESGITASADFIIYAMIFGFKKAERIRNRNEYSA